MRRTTQIEVASGRGVADRWRRQYLRGDKWLDMVDGSSEATYNRLCALGPDPSVSAVAEAIGNQRWSYIMCSGCTDYVMKAAKFGAEDVVFLCRDCLAEALRAIDA